MQRFRAWVFGGSPLRPFIFFAIVWGGLTWAASFATDSPETEPSEIIIRVLGALVFAALMTAFTMRNRTKSGGTEIEKAMTTAIQRRTLPPDADPIAWSRPLDYQRTSLRRSRWLTPIVLGAFAMLGVVLGVTGYPILGCACVVTMVGGTALNEVQVRRRLPAIEALIAQLGRVSDGSGSARSEI